MRRIFTIINFIVGVALNIYISLYLLLIKPLSHICYMLDNSTFTYSLFFHDVIKMCLCSIALYSISIIFYLINKFIINKNNNILI